MSNGEKRPPIRLPRDEDAAEEEVRGGAGGLSYAEEPRRPAGRARTANASKSSSGGWLQTAATVFMAFTLSIGVMWIYAAPKAPVISLQERVDGLEVPVGVEKGYVDEKVEEVRILAQSAQSSLEGYVKVGDVPDLSAVATTADLNGKVAALQARLAALEAEEVAAAEEEAAVEASSDTTRWHFEEPITVATLPAGVYLELDYDRIEDSGLYDVFLEVINNSGSALDLNTVITLIMTPRDYVMLDEDETYLDSDNVPFIAWRADFVVRERDGKDVCRRVEFESKSAYTAHILDGNKETFDLILELSYL